MKINADQFIYIVLQSVLHVYPNFDIKFAFCDHFGVKTARIFLQGHARINYKK